MKWLLVQFSRGVAPISAVLCTSATYRRGGCGGVPKRTPPYDAALEWLIGAAVVGLMLLPAPPAWAEGSVLEITITGIHSAAGHVLVAVCDKATFLQETCRYKGSVPATVGTVTVRIAGIPPGTYAAQAYADENDNHKIDRNFLGIPTEGIGFSNDARMRFGPPSFADAAFVLGASGGRITFALRYLD